MLPMLESGAHLAPLAQALLSNIGEHVRMRRVRNLSFASCFKEIQNEDKSMPGYAVRQALQRTFGWGVLADCATSLE